MAAWAALVLSVLASTLYLLRDELPRDWTIRAEALVGGVSIDHGVRLAMPDGVTHAASLYLPRGPRQALPTVLIRLPYDRLHHDEAVRSALWFSRHGHAVVVQDVRGKFGSQGLFPPWENATTDGATTLDWITRQAWSNGKVGTFGCSALGEMQYSLARARHPAAMIAMAAGGAWGVAAPNLDPGGFYGGGVLQLAATFGWSLQHGARDPGLPLAQHVDIDAALKTLPLQDMISRLQPGHNVFTDYLRMAPADAGWHWFDCELRGIGDGLAALPAYQFYVLGEGRWLAAAQWPTLLVAPRRVVSAPVLSGHTCASATVAAPQLGGHRHGHAR